MFGFISQGFHFLLYQPLFNFLVFLYNYIPGHDFGIAVVLMTVLIRILLYPSSVHATKSQKAIAQIQPKIKEIQEKYKDNKEQQAKATLDLYKEAKINPFGGILSTLVQLPIIWALYQVFRSGFVVSELSNLYSFVYNPGVINSLSLGFVDLAKPNIYIALLAGVVQYYQTKMLMPVQPKGADKADFASIMQKEMVYVFPVMTIFILLTLPSALGLYWAVGGIFLSIQQYFVIKKSDLDNKKND